MMRRFIFCIALLAATPSLAAPALAAPAEHFAIVDVRLFDGERVLPEATVIVRAGRIAAIGPDLAVPDGLPTVPGEGRTLLPGLIDSHTHNWGRSLEDAARFGVTTQIDMFTAPGEMQRHRPNRDGLAATGRADLFSAGMLATSKGGHGTQFGVPVVTLDGPDMVPGWVADRLAEGSDFIKIVYEPPLFPRPFTSIDRATMQAVIQATQAQDRLAVVHVSLREAARHAIADGVDGLVHIFADGPADAALVEMAAARDIFVVPTLAVIAGFGGTAEGQTLAKDPRVAPWLGTEQEGTLTQTVPRGIRGFDLDVALETVRRLHAAGVDILAGSDAPNPGTAHGASLHHELALLVRAGLSPTAALRAATALPAERFALADRGRVAAGMRADLVLVAGDPTANIDATRDIVQIWKNGHPVDRTPPARPASAQASLSPDLGDFETSLTAGDGLAWVPTTDAMMAGASTVTVERTIPGAAGSQAALRMAGEIKAGFIVPWAGAALGFSRDWSVGHDLTQYGALVLQARGTPGRYRVMLFDGRAGGPPVEQAFQVGEDWAEVRLPLARFRGADLARVVAIAVAAGPGGGAFTLDIDGVRLE